MSLRETGRRLRRPASTINRLGRDQQAAGNYRPYAAHTMAAVQDALVTKIHTLPDQWRRSLTWDQDSETHLHSQFTDLTSMPVYFRDPHTPWQHGSNENTNGLPRQYLPKGTDLPVHPTDHLDTTATELNNRPRMTLSWDTPTKRLTTN